MVLDEGLTRVDVRTEVSARAIVIPLDYNLLTNMESLVPSLLPLYTDVENRTLQIFKDADLSLGIARLALRVSF